jgi:G:T-mismatch repair DNA endonuclease (very short patch repair protein)
MSYNCIKCRDTFSKTNLLKLHINRKHDINPIENEKNFIKSQVPLSDDDFTNAVQMYMNGYTVYDVKEKYGASFALYIELLGIKRTASESKKTSVYKNRVEKTNLSKLGVKNPSQSKIIKDKKKETFLKNHSYENNFCNYDIRTFAQKSIDYEKVKESNSQTVLVRYGVSNIAQVPSVSAKISVSLKERCKNMSDTERRKMTEKARSSVKYVSKLENRVQFLLNALNVEYTANSFLYSYSWDLIFRNKVILEIQGDFWHANPNMYKPNDTLLDGLLAKDVWYKDEKKKKTAEKNGYSVFYLWENEINKMNDKELIQKLKEIIC